MLGKGDWNVSGEASEKVLRGSKMEGGRGGVMGKQGGEGIVDEAVRGLMFSEEEKDNFGLPGADCVFCRIGGGTEESAMVYSNSKVIAILDKYPVAHGHCLVMLRNHRKTMKDMTAEEARVLFEAVHLVARGTIRAMNAEGFNIGMNNGRAAGQTVGHVHVHIIPRYDGDDFWCTRRPQKIPDGVMKRTEELEGLAEDIKKEITRLQIKRMAKL